MTMTAVVSVHGGIGAVNDAQGRAASTTSYRSPLHRMVSTTATELWNDSCSVTDLRTAIEHGAVGATSNPTIVLGVVQDELKEWRGPIEALFANHPTETDAQLTWRLIEEMTIGAAATLHPIFERSGGSKGFLSLQTNPEYYTSTEALVNQGLHFSKLAPNIQVKVPATAAGIAAIEQLTARGVSVNATVCFTVPQAIAVAEAVERGLAERKATGQSTTDLVPVCTIMVGRLDDWLKVCCEKQKLVPTPGTLDWAGIACMKRAYQLYKQAGYKTRLLVAAFRNHLHWSEFIGGDVILTIPPPWQRRYNASSVEVKNRMSNPVPAQALSELIEQFPEFRRAYEPKGLKVSEFDHFGAAARTLRTFLGAYHDLVGVIGDLRLPNPDL